MADNNLTPKQQAMVEMWESHMTAEFKQKDIISVNYSLGSSEQ